MRILLDCRPLQSAGIEAEKTRLLFHAVNALAGGGGIEGLARGGDIDWVLVVDQRYRRGTFPGLPGQVVIRWALPGMVGRKLWGARLRRMIRRRRVDRVWLTGGMAVEGIKVPVLLWMPERVERLASGPGGAAAVICYSEQDRARLERSWPEAKDRIHVLTTFSEADIRPLTQEEKEEIRAEMTQEMEYFLADLAGCGEAEVMDLLKAFSLFKKRQQSRMRLVLGGGLDIRGRIGERLKTYKYREDVDWPVGAPFGLRALAGAAYAVVLPREGNSLGTTLLDMWKVGAPVIGEAGGLLEEMAQGAMLGIAAGDPSSLAGEMMRIYKEEELRRGLIGKGFERLKVYSRENFLRMLRVITEIAAC